MGLSVTSCFNGSYSGFDDFRQKVAKAAGIDDLMEWWQQNQYGEDELSGNWKEIPDDPIKILLCHSDCDGIIRHEHCTALADRLEQLKSNLPDEQMPDSFYWASIQAKVDDFIKGLRIHADIEEDIEFT